VREWSSPATPRVKFGIVSPKLTAEDREKRSAALSSLMAAVALTTMKTIVGLLTGSLGILAEAAHSGLDLVAALMTYIAVRISGRPADRTHLYGHGKVENLSALLETLLLFVTCGWIIQEALHRLLFHKVEVEVTVWSFAVMATSIAIDYSRSRLLARTAKKYNSQALEADALHFKTDVWSSAVVIAGLACVKLGEWASPLGWLREADAVAALGVSVLVIWVCWQLGRRTVDALVDSAPAGMEQRILAAVSAVPGVRDCHNIRVRYSGPVLFLDLHVLVDGRQTLFEAHALTETIEGVIQQIVPHADVTVHPEPY
jgi:cation diffusion facilitator family transporter